MASGLVVVLGVFLLADAAVRGSWDVVWVAVGPVAAIVWALWLLTVRPSVRLDDDALTVVNPMRTTRVPWAAVTDVRLRWQIVVQTADGRSVTCRGGPSIRGSRPVRRGQLSVPQEPEELRTIRQRWRARRAAAAPDSDVRRGWDRPAVVTGAAVAVLLLVSAGALAV
ncbi:PH domain-containing protein [Curtobacterium sp. 20TX0008]|uniref:PH domain-containing protein n=1 Tax=Curtobacterium sp. 20TX0008 TaxID=3022018 RepID=UPI00232C3489|nr:PH domain-containing protein [Curtobacterium sp. 20TX0008]MDB6427617.1 PH domain-containing protein [Curtobacterium sp. 20TX0008]